MAYNETLKFNLVASTTSFISGIRSANIALNTLHKDAVQSAMAIQQLGKAMTIGVTLPIIVQAAAAIKAFTTFDLELVKVAKTTNATKAQLDYLGTSFMELSQATGMSRSSIAGVAEAAGQLGVAVGDIKEFTEVITDLSVASNVEAEEGAVSLARIAKITNLASTEYRRLGSTIVEVGNNMATFEDRILDASTRMAGTANAAGISQKGLIALAGAVTSVRDRVESGATALSLTISKLNSAVLSGGEDLKLIAKIAGVSMEQFKTAFRENATEAIYTFVVGIDRLVKKKTDVVSMLSDLGLSGDRTKQTLLALAGANGELRKAIDLANKAWSENTSLTEKANMFYVSFSQRIKALGQTVRNTFALFGEAFADQLSDIITVLQKLLIGIQKLIVQFAEAPKFIKSFVLSFSLIMAAVGPVLVIYGTLKIALISLGVAFTAALTAVLPWAAAIGALVATFTLLLSVTKKMPNALYNEQKAMNAAFGELQATNLETDKRKEAIKNLNDNFGTYLDNLITEKSNWLEIYEAQKKANDELKRRGEVEKKQTKINKLYENAEVLNEKFYDTVSGTLEKEKELNALAEEYKRITGETIDPLNKLQVFSKLLFAKGGARKDSPLTPLLQDIWDTNTALSKLEKNLAGQASAATSASNAYEDALRDLFRSGKSGAQAVKDLFKIPISLDFSYVDKEFQEAEEDINNYIAAANTSLLSKIIEVIPIDFKLAEYEKAKLKNLDFSYLKEDLNDEFSYLKEVLNYDFSYTEGKLTFDFDGLKTAEGILQNNTDSLAQAIIYGQNFGDAMVAAIKAIAAQLVAKAVIFALLLP